MTADYRYDVHYCKDSEYRNGGSGFKNGGRRMEEIFEELHQHVAMICKP